MRSWHANNNEDKGTASVDPTRLIAAADAILRAESQGGKVAMWRDESKPGQQGFSSFELVQALLFLRRLGLISKDEPRTVRHDARPPM